MHFPFDPELRFGPWLFYLVLTCSSHVLIGAGLSVASLLFSTFQRGILALGTSIALSSGAGFLACLAFGNDMEPEQAMEIAERFIVAAPIVGTALFLWCALSWRTLYEEMDRPLWYGLTSAGACGTSAIVLLLRTVGPVPGFEAILALFMLGFLALYWAPTLMLPWTYLTSMGTPSRFTARLL